MTRICIVSCGFHLHGFHVPVIEATSDDKYSTVLQLRWICAAPAKNYELAIDVGSLTVISLSQAARERSLLPGVVVFVPVYDADRQLTLSVSTGRPFYATPVSRHATYRSSGVTVISWPCSQPLKLLRGAGRVVERFYCAAARVLFSVES